MSYVRRIVDVSRRGFLALAIIVTAAAFPAHGQVVDRVFPVDPPNGGSAGMRPILKIGVKGSELGKMKFRIVLSQDDFETAAYTFDQQKEAAGWAYTALGGESGAIYRVKEALKPGKYAWKVWAWNGVEWVPGKDVFVFTVDNVPPAEVEGIRMSFDRDRGAIVLDWSPVVQDRDGRPERVAKYNVYRYERKNTFFVIRPYWIGETESTHFEDKDKKVPNSPILFYRITAVDEAGNEQDRRY
jgi:hypothetical protein